MWGAEAPVYQYQCFNQQVTPRVQEARLRLRHHALRKSSPRKPNAAWAGEQLALVFQHPVTSERPDPSTTYASMSSRRWIKHCVLTISSYKLGPGNSGVMLWRWFILAAEIWRKEGISAELSRASLHPEVIGNQAVNLLRHYPTAYDLFGRSGRARSKQELALMPDMHGPLRSGASQLADDQPLHDVAKVMPDRRSARWRCGTASQR